VPEVHVTIIRRARIQLDPLAFSSANLHRTPGVHLTDVVRDMLATIGIGKRPNTFTREQLDAFALQGYLWEDALTETLVGRIKRSDGLAIDKPDYVRLPEIACNGQRAFFVEYNDKTNELLTPIPQGYIICSPDGGIIYPNAVNLLECKWTTKSVPQWSDNEQARADILNKWLGEHRPDWMWQAPCYLTPLRLCGWPVDTVEWHVQFPCGDYRGSGVIYEEWVRRYSVQEIGDKWSAVYGHALDSGMFV
jgi:hypothetical protein